MLSPRTQHKRCPQSTGLIKHVEFVPAAELDSHMFTQRSCNVMEHAVPVPGEVSEPNLTCFSLVCCVYVHNEAFEYRRVHTPLLQSRYNKNCSHPTFTQSDTIELKVLSPTFRDIGSLPCMDPPSMIALRSVLLFKLFLKFILFQNVLLGFCASLCIN